MKTPISERIAASLSFPRAVTVPIRSELCGRLVRSKDWAARSAEDGRPAWLVTKEMAGIGYAMIKMLGGGAYLYHVRSGGSRLIAGAIERMPARSAVLCAVSFVRSKVQPLDISYSSGADVSGLSARRRMAIIDKMFPLSHAPPVAMSGRRKSELCEQGPVEFFSSGPVGKMVILCQ